MRLLLVLSLLVALVSSQTLPFSGSPVINFGESFLIYSAWWGSYCLSDASTWGLKCDINLTSPHAAAQFAIANPSGSSGPVPSSQTVISALSFYGVGSWYSASGSSLTLYGNLANPSFEFAFTNQVQQSDGYLHGNVTQTHLLSSNGGSSPWCSAQPATSNSGLMQCNRGTVSAWEAFYFVTLS